MKVLQITGDNLLVNRIKEENKSQIIDLPTAGDREKTHKGTILAKGKGTPLNPLNDLHKFNIIVYVSPAKVPEELKSDLRCEDGSEVHGTLDIVNYANIQATI